MTAASPPYPACPVPFNMARHVLTAGTPDPDKTALSLLHPDTSEDWTFAALTAAVRGTATGLLGAGLTPGDRVLLRLGNTVDFPLAYLGALAAGLVPVPTAAALTAGEVAHIIKGLNPALILHDPDVPCPDDPRILPLDVVRRFRALPATPWHMGDPARLGYIVYTSGTAGKPSAVMHAHRAIWARGMMFDGWYGLRPDDRVLHAGAFNWTYTLGTGLMDPWTQGATALIPAPGTAPGDLPARLKTHDATIFAAAPGVYRQMLKDRGKLDLPHLRHGLSAGEKLAEPVRTAWEAATGTAIYEAYGMSECSTFISASPDTPARDGALGSAQPGRRISLRKDGAEVAVDTPGTIAVHRSDPGLMLGYLDDPAQTAARFDGDWFLTGDIGSRDADGQITYLGRDDDMMNAGGFRVSPLEVEAALLPFDDLTAVAAAEVEIKPGASVIAAFYTSAAPLDADALHRYAETKLARYKQPRLYVHLPQLPTGANGKVQRRALAPLYKAS
ncbi:class I adenylate-forming enzyme family protein [Sulfitobacter sp. JB4-11]|uniref:class I adenylate-forming enzyme family protein n=1 Tax=Sulfitobacter rhodophyticola TaxID=3238304 RepID=UPI003D814EEF